MTLPFATDAEVTFTQRRVGWWPAWFIMEEVCVLTYRAVGGKWRIAAPSLAEALAEARAAHERYLIELVVDRAALSAALDELISKVEARR